MACPLVSCSSFPFYVPISSFTSGPLVCNSQGVWEHHLTYQIPIGCSFTLEVCGPGGFYFSTVLPQGTYIIVIPVGSLSGVYTYMGTQTCGGIQTCTSVKSFTVVNYNNYPIGPIVINGQGNAICGQSTGFINAVVPINPYFNMYAIELWNGTGTVCLQNCNTFTIGNSISFTGLSAGDYCIRNYRTFPQANKSTCYSEYCFTIDQECILKATSCPDPSFPLTTLVFDGNSLPISIINKIIKAVFVSYTERCWVITETTDPITAVLISWIGPYDDCDTCSSVPCADILSSIIKTDELCNQGNGTATVTPLNGTPPYIYQWSNGGNTQTISGLSAGSYSVTIIDMNDCSGTNSVIINNVPCSNYYIITPCDSDVRAFVIKDPITSPNPNPNAYIGNVFEGTVTLSNGTVLTGCFTLSVTSQVSTATASINVTFYSHADCSGCLPSTWRLSRCDDNNIYYITNTDMSVSEGQVINNLVISGCGPGTFPCSTLPDQCWVVEIESTGVSDIVVESYGTVYPDCECCKPC